MALRDFQRLVVVFYGKPKPKMARYIRQVKDRAARKEDLMERFMIFKRKLKATQTRRCKKCSRRRMTNTTRDFKLYAVLVE